MKDVTVGEIIAYLETMPKDTKVRISVRDYYSQYGSSAHFMDFSMESGIWNHNISGGELTISAFLDNKQPYSDDEVVKYPKITFRK